MSSSQVAAPSTNSTISVCPPPRYIASARRPRMLSAVAWFFASTFTRALVALILPCVLSSLVWAASHESAACWTSLRRPASWLFRSDSLSARAGSGARYGTLSARTNAIAAATQRGATRRTSPSDRCALTVIGLRRPARSSGRRRRAREEDAVTLPFERVAIVGIGLIGGSLAAALKALPEPPLVAGVDVDDDARAYALAHGIVDEAYAPRDARETVEHADLVVLATPARLAGEWLMRLGEWRYAGVVTDVASTKAGVVAEAARHLGPGGEFIGGHPMAGSERSGVAAADPELFRGAYYVLTPTATTDADAYRRLHALIASMGARVISIRADEHDEAVAAISHVPPVAASSLTNLAAARVSEGSDVLRLAAGGFKDMTRIAAGSADLWTGICLDNREAVVRGIEEYRDQLEGFAGVLKSDDRDGVRAGLARAVTVIALQETGEALELVAVLFD